MKQKSINPKLNKRTITLRGRISQREAFKILDIMNVGDVLCTTSALATCSVLITILRVVPKPSFKDKAFKVLGDGFTGPSSVERSA